MKNQNKFFSFNGFTNIHDTFQSTIEKRLTENEAFEAQEATCDIGGISTTSPCLSTEIGVHTIFHDWNNGKNEAWGIVVAKNKRQAWWLLKGFENKFN